jgi:3-oxoacyl-[acyl-carrier-protein] synthase II
VLENEEHCLKRGAKILAMVLGYGNAFDLRTDKGYAEGGTGLKNAIHLALKDAALSPADIGCIFASANSTRGLDRMETMVIKHVFGNHAYTLPVTAIKSMIGESFSASGALSLSAAVGAIQHGIIPPTVNYQEQDPDCDLDYVPVIPRCREVGAVLLISSDPYGQNTAMVLGKQ